MISHKTLYDAASYDLNLFQERRVADMRKIPRNTQDRRTQQPESKVNKEAPHLTARSKIAVVKTKV